MHLRGLSVDRIESDPAKQAMLFSIEAAAAAAAAAAASSEAAVSTRN